MNFGKLLADMIAARSAPKPGYGVAAHGVVRPTIDASLPPDKQRELHSQYCGALAQHMGQLDDAEKKWYLTRFNGFSQKVVIDEHQG